MIFGYLIVSLFLIHMAVCFPKKKIKAAKFSLLSNYLIHII